MRLILLLIITTLLSSSIDAQKRNSPPRQVIIKGDAERTGILKSDGFTIDFPAAPTRSVEQFEAAYGKTNMVSYRLSTGLGFYGVNYIDFPTVMTDKAEMNLRFDVMKTALLKNPNDRLISETEIVFGDNSGVEYVIENKDATITMRGLFVRQRFFQLLVVTKGRMSKASEKVKTFNRKNIEKFINSFAVTGLPSPKTEAVELPADFGIQMSGSVFTSKFFGFSMTLPKDWIPVEKDQTDVLKDLSAQSAEESGAKFKNLLDLSLNNTEILLFLTKSDLKTSPNDAVFAVAAEKVSFPNFVPRAMTDSYLKTFLEADEKTSKPTSVVKLGGVDFAWIEVENAAQAYKQRIYIANRKGIAFQILLIYRAESELKTLLESMQTIKFSDVQVSPK